MLWKKMDVSGAQSGAVKFSQPLTPPPDLQPLPVWSKRPRPQGAAVCAVSFIISGFYLWLTNSAGAFWCDPTVFISRWGARPPVAMAPMSMATFSFCERFYFWRTFDVSEGTDDVLYLLLHSHLWACYLRCTLLCVVVRSSSFLSAASCLCCHSNSSISSMI